MIHIIGLLVIIAGFFTHYLIKFFAPSIFFFWVGFFLLLRPNRYLSSFGTWLNDARIGLLANLVVNLASLLYGYFFTYFSIRIFLGDLGWFLSRIASPIGTLYNLFFPVAHIKLADGTIMFTVTYLRSALTSFFDVVIYIFVGAVAVNRIRQLPPKKLRLILLVILVLIIGVSIGPLRRDIENHLKYGHIDVNRDLINGKDPERYKYWCHFAFNGWAEKEQAEFKMIIDKYGMDRAHCYNNDEIGISVSRAIPQDERYSVRISLFKNVITGKLRIVAQLAWQDYNLEAGNPAVEMDIPITEYNKILRNWLSRKNMELLVNAAEDANWEPIKMGKSYTQKPVVKVQYSRAQR